MHRKQLWKSDGTEAGTVLARDFFPNGIKPVPDDEVIRNLTATSDGLFFIARRLAPQTPPRFRPASTCGTCGGHSAGTIKLPWDDRRGVRRR